MGPTFLAYMLEWWDRQRSVPSSHIPQMDHMGIHNFNTFFMVASFFIDDDGHAESSCVIDALPNLRRAVEEILE